MVQYTHDRIRSLLSHVAESHSSIMTSVQQLATAPVLALSDQDGCLDAFYSSTQSLSEVLVTFNLVPPATPSNVTLDESGRLVAQEEDQHEQDLEDILSDVRHRLKLQEDAVMKVYELAQTIGSVSLVQKMESLSEVWGSLRKSLHDHSV
jgi:hypothetical protein